MEVFIRPLVLSGLLFIRPLGSRGFFSIILVNLEFDHWGLGRIVENVLKPKV